METQLALQRQILLDRLLEAIEASGFAEAYPFATVQFSVSAGQVQDDIKVEVRHRRVNKKKK